MLATPSSNTFDPTVRTAVAQLQQTDCRYDHIILASTEGSTSRSAPLKLIEAAAGGLDALRSKLRTHETRFALLRVQARLLLVVSLGQDLTGLKRAQVLVRGRALQSTLGATLFASVTIAKSSQLTSALVGSKLQLDGFAHISSPDVNRDSRASWSSASNASVTSRAKPSAPSSPEEAGHDAQWSRPISDVGPSRCCNGQLSSTSATTRAKSFHSSMFTRSPSDHGMIAHHGIVIDLESVVEGAKQDQEPEDAVIGPVPPLKASDSPLFLPADRSDNVGTPARPVSTSVTSTQSENILQQPIQLRKSSDTDYSERARSPREPLSSEERERLSDERERIRVDEAIRDEVMRKLRAEQQALLSAKCKSPATRTPRLAISPPLAPPPTFAPPPAPPSPPAASVASARSSNMNSPRLPCGQRHAEDKRTSPSLPADAFQAGACCTPSPQAHEVNTSSEGVKALTVSVDDAPRTSESQESIRSSIQSLSLWEFAEAASRRASFLSLPGHASSSPHTASSSSRAERLASGSASPSGVRSRQPSCSESVASTGHTANRCATSSSRGSVAASSIFDKELPAPPLGAGTESNDGEEWTGALGSPDSMTHPSAPWMEASLPLRKPEQSTPRAEDTELQDLRERLAQAEARAKAAEEAAKVAVREAQSETRRLAEELATVERGTRDKMEAEAIRRAKWAREQVARNQLDAYERSKLEAEEKRRRRAIEEQRQLECDRANRIREEQEWREQEAERTKQEYELRIQQLAEREAKLKAEAEAREQKERQRIEQDKARMDYRQARLAELKQALLQGCEGHEHGPATSLVSGWLNFQLEGKIQWRRRWYRVIQRQLLLSRSSTDDTVVTTIPLDPTKLINVHDDHEDCTMPHSLRFEVQLSPEAGREDSLKHTYLISTDTRAAKDEIELVIEAIAGL